MDLGELVAMLRCLDCGGELRLEITRLSCRGCGRSYPVVGEIPLMADPDAEACIWETYYRTLAKKKGDSESANGYFNGRSFRNVRDGILKLVGRPAGLPILDIGCGTGHFSQSLAKENQLVGADISFEMAVFAKKKGLATVRSSGKKLAFADESFAIVMSNNLIQSFADGAPFVREAARVLRPGGRLILSAANGQNLMMTIFRRLERRKYKHLAIYSADRLRRLLLEANLLVKSVLFFDFLTGRVSSVPGGARVKGLKKRLAATVAVEAVKPQSAAPDPSA
jgi:2-polyprenyl-3-methyl-5-hydroxy-6-metoxy-1,4-benzoquinol methylase/uncharacterized protein YbaR (Trm112 family)